MKAFLHRFHEYAVLSLILITLIVSFGCLSRHFLTSATFNSIANEIPTLALVATGTTLVLITGCIDLSVGSVLALAASVLGVLLVDWQWPLIFSGLAAVMVGLFAGLFNGLICVKLRVPSFIVTLGTLEMARGLAYLTTNSQVKYLGGQVDVLARPIAGITPTAMLAVFVVITAQFMLARAVIGRKMIALGTNETATQLAGISTAPIKVLVFAASGAFTGLASLCYVSRLGASDPNGGVGLELSAIAAAVIGGTSLSGGKGSVVCTFIGVLIIATLEAGLAQVGATEPMKRLVTGSVIVLAGVTDSMRKRNSHQ